MAVKKEPQKVIDLGSIQVLAGYFTDDHGIKHYWGDAEHIYSLRLTEADQEFLKNKKIQPL